MNEPVLRTLLAGLRAGLVSLLATADAAIDALGQPAPPAPGPEASGPCRHAKRLSAATMGHPTAWVCATPGCDAAGED